MAKKRVRKRQAWNKGREVGKRDGFTPDQVKQIRGLKTNTDPIEVCRAFDI